MPTAFKTHLNYFIMSTLSSTNSIVINSFGGDGGSQFAADSIQSLAIRSGAEVDAIIINGKKNGGDGGGLSTTLIFDSDEYISQVTIRSGSRVDNLVFTTNKGRTIGGGGDGGSEHTLSGIRVIAIGGKSGSRLDQIQITYVEDYVPSTLVEQRGQFVIGFTAQNTILKEYSESTYKTSDSYESVTETMLSQQYNASVEAEYYAKVSFSTEIKYVNTQLTTIKRELSEQLVSGKYSETTITEGHVGILLVNGTIMKSSDNQIWMFPNSTLSYAIIAISDYTNVLNHYDLTGELATQMPELLKYKTKKNGYVFYQNV
jgi:hypothetical protein